MQPEVPPRVPALAGGGRGRLGLGRGGPQRPDVVTGPAMARSPHRRSLPVVVSLVLGVALVVLNVGAAGSAFATSAAAADADRAGNLAEEFTAARLAVVSEEGLERKYRLEPGPAVLTAFRGANAAVDAAMVAVARDGAAPERTVAATIVHSNAAYLAAAMELFAATDRRDAAAALAVDHSRVDPAFRTMQTTIVEHATMHQVLGDAASARLLRIEEVARWGTSVTAVVAAVLLLMFTRLRRRLERQGVAQRRVNADQASHDALTGLPNRMYFSEQLESQVSTASAEGGSVGVLLLDLDRFKEINDTLGHRYGDLLLGQIGPRLREVLRRGEVMARFGGDQFALLMPTASVGENAEAELRAIAVRTLAALHAPFLVDGVALSVEASAGIAVYPEHGATGADLLQRADIAMYAAKGKHVGIAFYESSEHEYNPRKLALLSQLRVAVDKSQLVLYYQPLVDIASNQVRGAEALVRWQHPEHGLLPPSDFIPLAEGCGFIHELTRSVLRSACLQAMEWQLEGRLLVVSVNISARCLLDITLPETVESALAAVGLPPRLLKLEITESAIITDAVRAQGVINRLHELGVAMSIDDFGTGYGSLSYLRDLPVQELKIDRSFVSGMLSHPKDEVIVRTGIELAGRLGLGSVAEGVEDAATLAALAALGCTVAQGFYIGRPMPADVFHTWLVQRELGSAKALAAIA